MCSNAMQSIFPKVVTTQQKNILMTAAALLASFSLYLTVAMIAASIPVPRVFLYSSFVLGPAAILYWVARRRG